jgi:hypothetical protein
MKNGITEYFCPPVILHLLRNVFLLFTIFMVMQAGITDQPMVYNLNLPNPGIMMNSMEILNDAARIHWTILPSMSEPMM